MKKTNKSIIGLILIPLLPLLTGNYAYAQEGAGNAASEPSYHVPIEQHGQFWSNLNLTAVIFGILFVLGIYAVYHFVANGTWRNDMSE